VQNQKEEKHSVTKQRINILAIETSCDETAAAVISDELQVLASVVASQEKLHERFGGVVPEIASRAHVERILPVIEETLRRAELGLADIDAVAVANTPGLAGSLLVGLSAAKAMAVALDVPLVAVNHLQAHIYACRLAAGRDVFPCLGMIVSGGHSSLYRCAGPLDFELMGATIDDAAGEAFDKSAKLMGLGYPGGPALSRLAEQGDPQAFKLPRPLLYSGDLDFSFAGLKTAVLTQAKKLGPELEARKADLAAATQAAIVEVLVKKSLAALDGCALDRLVVAGGVGANKALRAELKAAGAKRELHVHYPEADLCTDNGAMIAMAAAMRLAAGVQAGSRHYAFDVKPRWPLTDLRAAA
jgi:N6-L-threonylcarbamoyladenine synthase